ncbi:MAG: metallophosphoesterase [Actinomycetes bacterium]
MSQHQDLPSELSPSELSPSELSTVANDEVVIHDGASVKQYLDLKADTEYSFDGHDLRTLPQPGELLTTFTSVNDLHFGELEAGKIEGVDEWPSCSVEPGDEPYPELMNRGAVSEMAAINPALVVVKGDLTAEGSEEEYRRFLQVYDGAFGERMVHVRGNHESYNNAPYAKDPFQERELPGVTVALLDTSVEQDPRGALDAERLDWLDELGQRSDRPVMVFGHHPVWEHAHRPEGKDTQSYFCLSPDSTEQLRQVFVRRPNLVGYFAGHTHRNRVLHLPGTGNRPFAELASVKEYPGAWAEYRVFDGGILQVHRRISTPEALQWSNTTRSMYAGLFMAEAFGLRVTDRCFMIDVPQ